MAKQTFYFTHDYNTRLDVKIKALLKRHGYLGYGIYWGIIEDLYNNNNNLPTEYDSIAFDYRVDSEVVKSIITEFDLFVIKTNIFCSRSVSRRLKERNEKSSKARKSALVRWGDDANAMRDETTRNAIKESKGKEIKVKKRKSTKEFVPPSLEDFVQYFEDNGYRVDIAERAWNGYNVAEWIDTKGNAIKNWKQKCQNVWFEDRHRTAPKPVIKQKTAEDFFSIGEYESYLKSIAS